MQRISETPSLPSFLGPPQGQGRAPGAEHTRLAQRSVYLVTVILVALGVGVALVFVEPMLVFGAIASLLGILAVIRSPYLGLLIYLVIFILRIGELYPVLEPLRIERTVGMLTLLSLILRQVHLHGRVAMDGSGPTRHFGFVILAAILSVPLAYWRIGAIYGVIDFLKILIFFYMVVMLVDSRAKFRGFFFLYLVLVCYIASTSVFNYMKGELLELNTIDRAVGATSAGGGPNELGATMATTIPIYLLLFLCPTLGRWRIYFLVGGMFMLFTMALSGSRSALVGLVGGLAYLWWKSKHRVLFGLLGVVVLAGAFVLLPDQYQDRYASITESNINIDTSQERIKVWKKGLRMIASRPITGVGIECFGTANAIGFSGGGRRSFLESHSLYIQVPAEMGLIGAVAFASFIVVTIRSNRRLTRKLRERDEDWGLEVTILKGILTGTIVLLLTGVFGHSLMRYTWYLYAAFVVSLWRIYLASEPSEADSRDLASSTKRGQSFPSWVNRSVS